MRLDRSVLSLVKRGSAIALVAVAAGCPDAPPAPPPPPALPVVGPAPPVSPTVTTPDPAPIASPAPFGSRKVENPACGGKHENVQKCPHCNYCPPCGGG